MSDTFDETAPSVLAVVTDPSSKSESLAEEMAKEKLAVLSSHSQDFHKILTYKFTNASSSEPEWANKALPRLAVYARACTADGQKTDRSDVFDVPSTCKTIDDTLRYLQSTTKEREDLALRATNAITLAGELKTFDAKPPQVYRDVVIEGPGLARDIAMNQRQIRDELATYSASSMHSAPTTASVSVHGDGNGNGDDLLSMLSTQGANLCQKQQNWRQSQFEGALKRIQSSDKPDVTDLFTVTTHLAYEMRDDEPDSYLRRNEDGRIRNDALLNLAVLQQRSTAMGDSKVDTEMADTVTN